MGLSGRSLEIKRGTWRELPVFSVMQKLGRVSEKEMFRTFNMGIGMVVICSKTDSKNVVEQLQLPEIGRIVVGDQSVQVVSFTEQKAP